MAETAKVFGFTHGGENSRERIYEIYKRLIVEKKLKCTNNIVTVT